MIHSAEALRCVESLDFEGMRRLWPVVFPHLPAPQSDADALARLHHARTQMGSIEFKRRAYSHAWLVDRGLPSGLPDNLRPKAERIYPVIVHAVGVAVKSKYEVVRREVRGAMNAAVFDAEAEGRLADAPFVKSRMAEARSVILKKLFG